MRIPNDEWDAIKNRAKSDGTTATDLVREAVRRYLATKPAKAVLVALVLLAAGCGNVSAVEKTPTVTVTQAQAAVQAGAPQSCLSAARIAPPAWAGVKLSKDSAHRIGVEFNNLTDDCLSGPATGSAPSSCRKAAETMNLYKNRTLPIADIDAQYRQHWSECING